MRLALICLLTACWHEPAKPQPVEPKPPVKDIVQPVKIEKQQDDDGVEGGEEGGVVGGVVGGDPCGNYPPPPPPPPPPPSPPQNIPPTLLEGLRIAGQAAIQPDDATKTEITRSGKDKIIGSFKLCVATTGDIASVTQLKTTGFPAYDTKLMNTMRYTWRYKPFMVNGRAVPVCTAVTFIYSQSAPPPPQQP